MLVWLIKTGEPIPSDGENVRLMRMGILAEYLTNAGHEVVWWNANFNHSSKSFRYLDRNLLQVSDNLEIRLLNSSGYRKNVSFQRLFVDHPEMALNFQKEACSMNITPDVIVSAYPTPGLCEAALDYGAKRDIPVIIDIRDLWPDAFLDPFPSILRPFIKLALFPFYWKTKNIMQRATALTGISEPFLNWGLRHARRNKGVDDNVFPFGYKQVDADPNLSSTFDFINTKKEDKARLSFCYIGNLSHNLDMVPIRFALLELSQSDIDYEFIICGRGVAQDDFRKVLDGIHNVHFTGFINANEIAAIMEYCDMGIVPYIDTPNFQNTISNKVIEYLAGGLPILTSIDGYMGPFLTNRKVGLVYKNSKELMTHLCMLAGNRELLKEMEINALNLYESNFKAEHVYRSFVSLIEKLGDKN